MTDGLDHFQVIDVETVLTRRLSRHPDLCDVNGRSNIPTNPES